MPRILSRRILDGFLQGRAQRFGSCNTDAFTDHGFVVADFSEDAAFGVGEFDAIVIAGDGDAAVVVFHRGEQGGQALRRIRRVVTVVAAVQFAMRTLDGQARGGVAAVAKDECRFFTGVARAVVYQDGIGAQ